LTDSPHATKLSESLQYFRMFLRRLNLDTASDRAIASELFLATPSYELETFGRMPSGDTAQSLSERFPEGCPPEHRLTIAAFNHDQPIGLSQIALHVPEPDCAALLLLLVPTQLQQRHIGCEIVERLSRQARRWPGIARWYISVLESNTTGLAFWRHCGFRTTSQGATCEGINDRITLMTRSIKGRPVCQHHRGIEDPQPSVVEHLFARLP